MTRRCRLTQYSIKIFGIDCNIHDIIKDMLSWKGGLQTLSETAIVESQDLSEGRNIYLYNIMDEPKYYLITLWEAISGGADQGSNVTSIDLTSSLDNIKAHTNKKDDNLVPGRPKVFIFPKDDFNTAYSFTWEYHNQTGVTALKVYMTAFLNNESCFNYKIVTESKDNSADIEVSIEQNSLDSVMQHVNFVLKEIPSDRDGIIANIKDIRYITRTSRVQSIDNPDIAIWEKFLPSFNKAAKAINEQRKRSRKTTTSRVKYTPNKRELEKLFSIYDGQELGIENIKFEFDGRSNISPINLKRCVMSNEYEIDLVFKKRTNLPNFEELKGSIPSIL